MYLRNMKNYQSMNVVYTNTDGNELWLGDYYAATNLDLLKKKNITTGTINLIQFLLLLPCLELSTPNN